MLVREIIERSSEYEKQIKEEAARVLGAIEEAARAAGVACNALHRTSDSPWQEIIKVATEQGCDLIVMASHGVHGVSALLLGSGDDQGAHALEDPGARLPIRDLHPSEDALPNARR